MDTYRVMPSAVLGFAHFLPGSRLRVSTVSEAMVMLYALDLREGVNLSSMFDSSMPWWRCITTHARA